MIVNTGGDSSLSCLFSLDDHLKAERKPNGLIGLQVKVEENDGVEEVKDGEEEEDVELKTMKEFIDLELGKKKKSGGGVGFWETASLFSKKLLKWKQNRKNVIKDDNNNNNPRDEIKSEIGVYGYLGRRSCDTDPRLSVDNVRYSFEEPRASWDGYLIGRGYSKMVTSMAAVEEKANSGNEDESSENLSVNESPGGSTQTREYYGECLGQRRRRSFDLTSGKRINGLVDVEEVKSISNAKVSPETVGLFHGAKLLVTEKELRDSNWYSIKDYRDESEECVSKKNTGGGESEHRGLKFKKLRNMLNMWGFKQKRGGGGGDSKCHEEKSDNMNVNVNVEAGPLSDSWQKLKRVANGDANGTVSEKLIRSYSVSARNSSACKTDGLCNSVEGKEVSGGAGGLRRRDELILQRNRTTTAYSPNNLDNGLLRFYLTPVRSYRRSKSGRSKLKSSQSMAMNGL